ncbi:MAG TPA: multidrug efflux SMR transporter [Actinomycetota bacterium]|nr:multidrug efflux SMR transporter [Actinomycetota bacterium]
MNAWLMLGIAIVSEIAATASLRASQGFTRLVPSIVVVIGYALSFFLLAHVLKTLPVGMVYAIWSAVGVAVLAVLGRVIWGDALPPLAILGLALIIGGILLLRVAVGPVE